MRMITPRDSQRSKVYQLERNFYKIPGFPEAAEKMLTLNECQRLINLCWMRINGEVNYLPTVRDGRGRRIACYQQLGHLIKLPLWARSGTVVCHEVAHAIVTAYDDAVDPVYRWHGTSFMKVFIHLMSFVYDVPEAEFRKLAKKHRVKCRSAFPIKTKRIPIADIREFRNK